VTPLELVVREPIHLVTQPTSEDLIFSGAVVRDSPAGRNVEILGKRLYVLPGLVDAHAHLMTSPTIGEAGYTEAWRLTAEQIRARIRRHLAAQASAGVAAVRDAGASQGDVADFARLHPGSARPRLQAAGRFIAPPRRYPLGVAHEVRGASTLATVAADEARRGGGWVKLIGDYLDRDAPDRDPAGEWSDDEIEAAVVAAHEAGAKVAIHATTARVARQAVQTGIDTIEHGCGLSASDLRKMAAQGIAWTPTLAAFIRLLDRIRGGEQLLPAAFMETAVESLRSLVPLAAAAGVVILCGTDGILRHGDVLGEILALSEAGLPPYAALRAATVDGWGLLGLGEPLRDGATADALLFDSNPLDDLTVLQRPVFMIRAGRLIRPRPAG
jgi:imidazolonepropionase-like amidohydrolase